MTRIRRRPPTHPGRILKELYLTPLNITTVKLSGSIGVSRKAISQIINEKKSVTPEMALRLSYAFPNTSAEFWLNLQKNYDLWLARMKGTELHKIQPLISTTS